MAYDHGISDWRVYAAEQAVGHDEQLDADGCVDLVEKATSSGWWFEWFPDAVSIEVVIGGDETVESDGEHRWSYAAPWGHPKPTKYQISLHPKMLTARVVLHELAHCVAPIYVAEDLGPSRKDWPLAMRRRQHRTHGECFTAALSVITDNMLPGDDGQLATAYAHYEVPIASPQELREQLAAQRQILDDQQAFHDEIRRYSEQLEADYEAEHGERRETLIPTTPWGWYLLDYRRSHHRRVGGPLLSQKKLAEEISQVTPCTAKNISALEHLRQRPEDPAQLKRAMLMTIYLCLDPIWTRYNLWLTRWDCGGITMKEAKVLNPLWAKTVTKMNRQLRQMPPKWKVDGER